MRLITMAAVCIQLTACAGKQPAAPSSPYEVSVIGTVIHMFDGTVVDGAARFVVKGHDGRQIKFHLGSIFTRTAPTEEFSKLHSEFAGTRNGDEVLAEGSWMTDSVVNLENFKNLSRANAPDAKPN